MTGAEKTELEELGKESCPCFCTGNKDLAELMTLPTAPRGEPWIVWIRKPEVIKFVNKFFPEFCVKMQRFAELYEKQRKEVNRPLLF